MQAINREEIFSAYSHLTGALLSLIGTAILLKVSQEPAHRIVSLIYGLSVVFLFTASFLYHADKKGEDSTTVLRKLDHSAIFFMIAGTYTPLCYIYLEGTMMVAIITAQWIFVVIGLVVKLFYLRAPRFFSAGIYLIMGWLAVVILPSIIRAMPALSLVFLFSGAGAFTLGAGVYILKRPDPVKGFFGFHEIFHVLILIGAACHYATVLIAVM